MTASLSAAAPPAADTIHLPMLQTARARAGASRPPAASTTRLPHSDAASMPQTVMRPNPQAMATKAELYAKLGNVYTMRGDLGLAGVSNYKAALRLEPGLSTCWCNLGNVHLQTGRAPGRDRAVSAGAQSSIRSIGRREPIWCRPCSRPGNGRRQGTAGGTDRRAAEDARCTMSSARLLEPNELHPAPLHFE